MQTIPNELLKSVAEAAKGGKVACAVLHKLAREHNVAPRIAGQAANELKLKIVACQLGCFK